MISFTALTLPVCAPPAPAAGRAQLHGHSTGLAAGAGAPVWSIHTAVLTSQVTRNTTSLSDVEELALPVAAHGAYIFDYSGTYSMNDEIVVSIVGALGGPTGASNVLINHHYHTNVGSDLVWWNGCTTSFGASNTPDFYEVANTRVWWRIYGSFETGSQGGVIAPRFARSSGGGTLTVQAGAHGWVRRIA